MAPSLAVYLHGALAEIDRAIAAAKNDREITANLWRARAEIVRAKVVAEREVKRKPVSLTCADGDVKDFEIG